MFLGKIFCIQPKKITSTTIIAKEPNQDVINANIGNYKRPWPAFFEKNYQYTFLVNNILFLRSIMPTFFFRLGDSMFFVLKVLS